MSQYQPPSYYPPQPQDYQQPPKKTSIWTILGIIACALIIGVVLLAVAARAAQSIPTSYNTSVATSIVVTADTSSPTSQPSISHSIGQPVSVGFWQATINSVKTSHGDDVSSPKSGSIYLVIDVTVVNISQSNQLLASGYYFRLTDSTGQPYDEKFTDFGGPPEGNIISGGKLRGQLIYEVPTTENTFTLQLQGDQLGQAVAIWNISVK